MNFFNKFDMEVGKPSNFIAVVTTLLFFITGCAGQPYINVPDEFNRDSNSYLHGPQSRDKVEICYNKRNTNPKQIIKIASKECMRYGKRAKFSKNSYTICPIRTPVAAIYYCYELNKGSLLPNKKAGS